MDKNLESIRLAVMQPYFFPYIGYFQLMNTVDEFVVYDNIEYTKKGWINRNRILVNGKDVYITLPIKAASDFLDIKDRQLADAWSVERKKMLNRILNAYQRAPYFRTVYPLVEEILLSDEKNLFRFILNSLILTKEHLGIKTPLVISSTLKIDHELRSERKVIAICLAKGAREYVNPIGGLQLYTKDGFKQHGIDLHFLKTNSFEYKQYDNDFIPFLSIIDVMMFCSKEDIQEYLRCSFTLV